MKKLIVFAIILSTVACQQSKIGFVDNVKLMDDYQEKKEVEAKFQAKVDALTKKRDSISQAFRIEAQAYQAKYPNPNSRKAQEEGAILQQKSQFIAQQLQQEEQQLQLNSQTEMDSLVSKVKREIADYGKANGFTYILGGGAGGAVLYGEETLDLTDAMLKILNDKYDQ